MLTTITHTYAAGTYHASLSATDDGGGSAGAAATALVDVASGGTPAPTPTPAPSVGSYTVSLAASAPSIVPGGVSTLTATVTQNGGASAPTSFAWSCYGATIDVTNVSTTHLCAYPTGGFITSAVTVSNGMITYSGFVIITVDLAPVVSVSCPGAAVPSATTCTVSATLNGAPVASSAITNVAWTWGDGSSSLTSSNVAPHTFAAGTYTVDVIATVTGATRTGSASTSTTVTP